MNKEIDQSLLDRIFPRMVEWRRYLHQHPELSFQEYNTSRFVAETLRNLGMDVRTGVGGHGVVGILKGSLEGPVVALRADIDALPIQDEKECGYASKTEGVMHACGHDGHTATLLGVASYFSERRSLLRGEIRFLFQPAEEVIPGGAIRMIGDGALDGVDVIYGVHLWTPLEAGKVSSVPGPMMASVDDFVIDVIGKGGHGGLPHDTVDSVVVGASIVLHLQTVVSRSVDPLQPAVVSVGSIQAGTTQNVIADRCRLKGTVRTFDEHTRTLIRDRIEATVRNSCAMYGAEAEIEYLEGYPTLVNDERETERFFRVATALFGEAKVERCRPVMPAEDFAYYLQRVPGCFLFVGAGNERDGIVHPHHHPRFDIDEASMMNAAKVMIRMAVDYALDGK